MKPLAVRSLGEVGRILGISRQRVQLIESEALRKMRARLMPLMGEDRFPSSENPHGGNVLQARMRAQRRKRAIPESRESV